MSARCCGSIISLIEAWARALRFCSAKEMPRASALALEDAVLAFAGDDAGQDGVGADAELAELHGEGLGEADHGPFRRRIGRAQGEAEFPGRRRDVDDAAVAALLQMRHGEARAVELARDVDREAAVPFGGVEILHPSRRPGDAGIVDEAVEPAERLKGVVEEARHLRADRRHRWSSGSPPDRPRRGRAGPPRPRRRCAPSRPRAGRRARSRGRCRPAPAVTRTRNPAS